MIGAGGKAGDRKFSYGRPRAVGLWEVPLESHEVNALGDAAPLPWKSPLQIIHHTKTGL